MPGNLETSWHHQISVSSRKSSYSAVLAPCQPQDKTTTILLVDDDPLQAYLRRAILERRLTVVERATDAAEAFILIEQPLFAEKLGLIIVGLHLPGVGGPAFVAEMISRLPSVPILVLGSNGDKAADYTGLNVQFMSRPIVTEEMLAMSRQMLNQHLAGVA